MTTDHGLTARQAQVVALLRDGLTNRQIADRLGLAEGTVKTHVTACLQRLGVSSRVQAAAILAGEEDTLATVGERIDLTRLTERQSQILQLVAEGCTNRQIANQLHIAEKTVKTQLTIVYLRLGAVNRAHAAAILRRAQTRARFR